MNHLFHALSRKWAGKQKLLLAVLASAACFTACSSSRRALPTLKDRATPSPVVSSGFTGVLIYDPTDQQVLFEHNADKFFTPASNIKLFTFYAGLKILKDSVPAISYISKKDSLVFWGTGDPSFLHPTLTDSQTLQFLKNASADLFYVAPEAEEKKFGPGWAWDDYNSSYSAERSVLPIYGNVVSFSRKFNDSVPTIEPRFFENFLLSDSLRTSGRVLRHVDDNRFYYGPKNVKNIEQQVPFRYSDELAVALLRDTLGREVTLLRKLPGKRTEASIFYSIPTDTLYKKMLRESDNFIAEQILLMSAGRISDTLLSETAIKYTQQHHLQDLPHKIQWVDGSGLSRYNLVTPRALVTLLEKIYREVPQERLFHLLPTGGVSGTLKDSYKAENPYIFAKTGSLGNVSNLSGYLETKTGKILIFSFMNNNFTEPTSAIKQQMELFLRNVHLTH